MASNDSQRTRAKAHRAEISPWYRTNVGLFESKHGAQSASCCLKLRLVRSRPALGNHWLPSSAAVATSQEGQARQGQARKSCTGDGAGNAHRWKSGHLNAVNEARASLGREADQIVHEKVDGA